MPRRGAVGLDAGALERAEELAADEAQTVDQHLVGVGVAGVRERAVEVVERRQELDARAATAPRASAAAASRATRLR